MFEFFYGYDYFCAESMNRLLKSAGVFFTPFFRAVTFLGELGWAFILASLVMLFFRRTRKAGAAAVIAIAFGAVLSNLILKNAIARPRPFHTVDSPFYAFWTEAGSLQVREYSFPSGHATATTAFAVALVFALDKRASWTALFLPLVMGVTRVYFQVHFASDVLFGYVVGAVCGTAGWFTVKGLGKAKPFNRFFEGSGIVDWVNARRKRNDTESADKPRAKKNQWVKKRHARVFAFLRLILRPIFAVRYRYHAKKSGLPKGAYLILCNHQTTMDPFFLSLSFRFPVYFISSDDIFNLKVSPLIRYLVAPIPKSKSLRDVVAMKNVFRVIKEGGAVGIFPEGNRTISGGQWEMTDAVAKLAKGVKVPLVLYNLHGGFGTDPRWGHSLRRGKFHGGVRRVLSPEELASLSTEELFALIKEELRVDDTASGVSFKSGKRAEYIERALYLCPVCGSVSSYVSHKYKFACKECGTSSTYTPELALSPRIGEYRRIYEWFEWEREEIVKRVLAGEKVGDDGILFRESVKFQKKKKLAGESVWIDKENLVISGGAGESVFPLCDIVAMTMVGKKKFNFYYDGKILQVKGNKRFCAIKYVHVFDGLRANLNATKEKE